MTETLVLIFVGIAAVTVFSIPVFGLWWVSRAHDEDSLLDRLIDR